MNVFGRLVPDANVLNQSASGAESIQRLYLIQLKGSLLIVHDYSQDNLRVKWLLDV